MQMKDLEKINAFLNPLYRLFLGVNVHLANKIKVFAMLKPYRPPSEIKESDHGMSMAMKNPVILSKYLAVLMQKEKNQVLKPINPKES